LIHKKIIRTLLTTSLLSSTLFCAPSGVYVEVGAGVNANTSINTIDNKASFNQMYNGSLALGYQADAYRFELEERYAKSDLDGYGTGVATGDITKESRVLNVYYSGYNESNMVTTFGAGVGLTNTKLSNMKALNTTQTEIFEEDTLTLQGTFSIGYMFTPHITTSGKYIYHYVKESDKFKSNTENIFNLTLRYLF